MEDGRTDGFVVKIFVLLKKWVNVKEIIFNKMYDICVFRITYSAQEILKHISLYILTVSKQLNIFAIYK